MAAKLNRGVLRLAALLLVCLNAAAFAEPVMLKTEPCDIPTQAAAMALIEAETGTFIAGQNADEPLPMASTTKIMTALVVLENCGLGETVSVDESAIGVEGSSMYLQSGEKLSVEDLLYGLMLSSGNDAAVALACHAGGSAERFVGMMNEKAATLGLKSTHFANPNGLTAEGHHTTARELCIIAREAMRNETFRTIVGTKYHTARTGSIPRTLKNKNALLWDYEGTLGVKTGYTDAAGRCLVFCAERDGMTLIGCVLNCRPMFETAARLMDAAFDTLCMHTVIGSGERLFEANVKNGIQNVLAVEAKDSIIAVVRRDETAEFTSKVTLNELSAPIAKGDIVGEIEVFRDGEPVGSSPLAASHSVSARGVGYWFLLLARAFSG